MHKKIAEARRDINMDLQKFLEIEEKYHLNTETIEGIHYWQICRFVIWQYTFCTLGLGLGEAHYSKQSKVKDKVRVYISLLVSILKKMRTEHHEVLFIAHERRIKEGEWYSCIYTDELAEKYDSVTIEHPHNGAHLRPAKTKNLIYTDSIVVRGNLYAAFHQKLQSKYYKKIYGEVVNRLKTPLGEMLEAYELAIPKDKIYNLVVKRFLIYKKEAYRFEKLLKKIRPNLIVEVCHYSMQCMIINSLAKSYRIPTIELQHGTMHEEHAAYQYSVEEKIMELPDYVFTFSEYWNQIVHMPSKTTQLISVGFPYFEKKIKKYQDIKVESYSRKVILFVSQGTIGEKLSKLAVELSQCLMEEKFCFIYKLHPGEFADWKERYPWLVRENRIEVVDSAEHSIYEYFVKSDIQVGVYSTAIYEGLGFGLTTYIYNVGHADTMRNLEEQGYVKIFNSAVELKLLLKDEENYKEQPLVFWEINALQNMRHEIERIIKSTRS